MAETCGDWNWLLPAAVRDFEEPRYHLGNVAAVKNSIAYESEESTVASTDQESDNIQEYRTYGSDSSDDEWGRDSESSATSRVDCHDKTNHRSFTTGKRLTQLLYKHRKADEDSNTAFNDTLDATQGIFSALFMKGRKAQKRMKRKKELASFFIDRRLPQPPSMIEDDDENEDICEFEGLPKPPSLVYEYQLVATTK